MHSIVLKNRSLINSRNIYKCNVLTSQYMKKALICCVVGENIAKNGTLAANHSSKKYCKLELNNKIKQFPNRIGSILKKSSQLNYGYGQSDGISSKLALPKKILAYFPQSRCSLKDIQNMEKELLKKENLNSQYLDKFVFLSILIALVAFGDANVKKFLDKFFDAFMSFQRDVFKNLPNGSSSGTPLALNFSVQAGDCTVEEGSIDPRLRMFMKPFILTDKQQKDIYCCFQKEVDKGLDKGSSKNADIKCYPTFVTKLPTGEEVGKYLALDLGGTNFRVLLVDLKGKGDATMKSDVYEIPKSILSGTSDQLFDHVAECVDNFLKKHKLNEGSLPLGFTFSFPCNQLSLKKATLVRWTKGFKVAGVEGKDVAALLKDAFKRREITVIDVVAVLNDTTGTLMSCAHRNPDCRVGTIIGTGSNCCYWERTECVGKFDDEIRRRHPNMIINCELGAFGDSGTLECIRTPYDKHIDKHSLNKGTQLFEKMIAGMYLGELVRLILYCAIQKELIFDRCANRTELSEALAENVNIIETQHLSQIEADGEDFKATKNLIKQIFGMSNPSIEDCRKLKFICECISTRSSTLISIAIAGLINRSDERRVVVGIDGSLYRFHPKYDARMREVLDKFVEKGKKYDLMLSEDGSGRGAALVAAVASSKKNVVCCKE